MNDIELHPSTPRFVSLLVLRSVSCERAGKRVSVEFHSEAHAREFAAAVEHFFEYRAVARAAPA